MKKINRTLVLCVTVVCCLLASSCKNSSRRHTAQDKKYHPGKLVAASAKFYCIISNETKTKLEVNDQQTETANSSSIGMVCEMHNDTAGRRLVTLTYDTFHIVTAKNGDVQEINSLASSDEPVEKLLASLKGVSLHITLDSEGHVLSTAGSQEVVNKIMAGLYTVDERTAKQVREMVSRFAGESFVKNNIDELFNLFPDTTVYVGDTWTRKTSQTSDLPYESVTTYTLASVTDGKVQVESAAKIGEAKESKTNLMGYDVSTNLNGEQSGEYEAEERTGMVVKSKTETDLKGTIELLGKIVPVKINTIHKVITRKM